MKENVFFDLVRGMFAMLDRVIYGLVTTFYNTIVDLSSVQVVSGEQISEIAGRIYAYLGIFMLFKISFSLINYLVDPDKIVDKAKGGGQLIKNIIITFVLIITVPFGFDMLYEAQSAILSDNILPKLIFSDETANNDKQYQVKMAEDCDNNASTNNAGDYVGLMIFRPFFTIDDRAVSTDWDQIKSVYCAGNSTGNDGNASVRNLLKYSDIYNAPQGFSTKRYYVVDYTWLISTAVGVFVALLFLSFCFDVAVRMLKLLFLELIAPIPIISFIDPDSSKNGIWKKWIKEVGKTWLSLFVRLMTVYFAVYIIGLLSESELNFLSGYEFNGSMLWLKALLAIGALIFARDLPKIIENILGIKLGESLQLNPLKKLQKEALGGKALTGVGIGAAGLAVGAGTGILSNGYNFFREKSNLRKAEVKARDAGEKDKADKLARKLNSMGTGRFLSTTTGGMFGGARRGATSGYKTGESGKANVFKNVGKDLKESNTARNNRTSIRDYNREVKATGKGEPYGFFQRNVSDKIDTASGLKNEYGGYGFYDKQIKDLEREIGNNDAKEAGMRNQLSGLMMNHQQDQLMIEKLHESMSTKGTKYSAADFIKENGISPTDYATMEKWYNDHAKTALTNIDTIDSKTKKLKAEKKQYEEMLKTRREVEKK